MSSKSKTPQPASPAIATQVEAAFLAARSVHRKLTTLADQTETRQSREFMFQLTNAMGQIIAVLNTKDVELVTKETQARRDKITEQIGTNVYVKVKGIIDILDDNGINRDADVRKELLSLLAHFPAANKDGAA